MHLNYLRDIPLALGAIALLVGSFRNGFEVRCGSSPDSPQWLCRFVFLFVGMVLIGFGILGNYSPR